MAICKQCRDTGWIPVERGGVAGVRPCACREERQLRYRLQQAGIPPRFLDAEFDTFQPIHESQAYALELAVQFAQSYPEVESGLFFVGPTGVGKTHLMVATLKALAQRDIPVLFCDCNELLTQLRRSYHREALVSEAGLIQPLLDTEVVLLDDLGAHRASEWVFDVLFSIINYRYNHRKPLLVTSNLVVDRPGEDVRSLLVSHLSQRVYSRLAEMCLITVIRGPDYRVEIRQPTWQQTRGTGDGLARPNPPAVGTGDPLTPRPGGSSAVRRTARPPRLLGPDLPSEPDES
jgi:DNA replication protein DnaC